MIITIVQVRFIDLNVNVWELTGVFHLLQPQNSGFCQVQIVRKVILQIDSILA